jgi:hypothetical protein
MQGQADEADVVKLAGLGNGEQLGVSQAEHRAQAEQGKHEGCDAAYPAGTEMAIVRRIELVAESVHVTSCDWVGGDSCPQAESAGVVSSV